MWCGGFPDTAKEVTVSGEQPAINFLLTLFFFTKTGLIRLTITTLITRELKKGSKK
jgi:hypothetical protein